MEKQWTPAQEAAISTRNRTLLVSAAAGAGKTAALTERLIRRLTDKNAPAEIDRMLIVTFTRAAASELRERIAKALSDALAKNPTSAHLSRQLVKLSEAHISTIDSFFLDVVRSNFSLLGLPPKFRMADSAELALLKSTVMNELIEEYYCRGKEYGHFFDHFSEIRSDRNLSKVFLSLYDDLGRYPEGIAFLDSNADRLTAGREEDYFLTSFGEVSASATEALLNAAIALLSAALCAAEGYEPMKIAHAPTYAEELSYLRVVLAAVKARRYGEVRELIHGYSPKSMKSIARGMGTEETALYMDLRKSFNAEITKLKKSRFLLHEDDIRRTMTDTASVSHMLAELLRAYDERIRTEKLRRALCDFDDIRKYAYALLVGKDGKGTAAALAYTERFDEIYIDEYQDVDSVQDLIFRAIAREDNRFLVGDIKQSIYGFRGANPSVFASYRSAFPKHGSQEAEESPCRAIYMSENFRCDAPVIHFTNLVCGTLFSVCSGGLAYRNEDALIKAKPDVENAVPAKTEVILLSSDEKNAHAKATRAGEEVAPLPPMAEETEAAYIVSRIRSFLTDGRKADGSPILPKDIAVLARGKNTLTTIAAELKLAGIESCIAAEEDFFENPEVLLLLSLLNVIDNPHRDIYLSGTLRSPLYGFTLTELVTVRTEADEGDSLYDALLFYRERHPDTEIAQKASRFKEELDRYRTLALSLPVDRLIRHVFMNPRLTSGGGLSSVLPESRHLLRLYEYARQFEAGAFRGLYQFVSYIERLIAEKEKLDLPVVESDNAIRLMTIHKSKGLEFPICFIAHAGKKFNLKDSADPILVEEELGAAMKLSDESGFARLNTPMRDAIAVAKSEKSIEEEMRVLYVALTRARERLIVTTRPFGTDSFEKRVRSRCISPSRYSVMACRSYIEWILYALTLSPDKGEAFTDLRIVQSTSVPPTAPASRVAVTESERVCSEEEVAAYVKAFRSQFSYRYPYESIARIPAKLSVSKLYPGVLDESDDRGAVLPSGGSAEQGSERDDAAKRGTATHCFLQFCNPERAKQTGAEEELRRLTEQRFLSAEVASLCRIDELDAFLESDLFLRLSRAKRVWREQRFNIFLPAAKFTEDPAYSAALRNEKILVQGVIDLFFYDENGRLILADYKTDRISDAERRDDVLLTAKMKERHGEQLSYYALAVEQLLGQKPDEILVYVTAAGRAVSIAL